MKVAELPIYSQVQAYRPVAIQNKTLITLVAELGAECQNVLTLIHQLQLASLSPDQQIDVLADLTSAVIHLQAHCGEDFQELIADELESVPSHDDAIDAT